MGAESTTPLLNLDTLIVRPTIEIDGTRYEILSPDELSVMDARRFGLWAEKLQKLQEGDEADPESELVVDQVARKAAIGVPDDVFARLSGVQKTAVAEVFIVLLLRRRMRVAGATSTAMGNPSIGESLFPGFSAFTGAPRGCGWRTRLSRWFQRTPG